MKNCRRMNTTDNHIQDADVISVHKQQHTVLLIQVHEQWQQDAVMKQQQHSNEFVHVCKRKPEQVSTMCRLSHRMYTANNHLLVDCNSQNTLQMTVMWHSLAVHPTVYNLPPAYHLVQSSVHLNTQASKTSKWQDDYMPSISYKTP